MRESVPHYCMALFDFLLAVLSKNSAQNEQKWDKFNIFYVKMINSYYSFCTDGLSLCSEI